EGRRVLPEIVSPSGQLPAHPRFEVDDPNRAAFKAREPMPVRAFDPVSRKGETAAVRREDGPFAAPGTGHDADMPLARSRNDDDCPMPASLAAAICQQRAVRRPG